MREKFQVVIWNEGEYFVAQCLDVDIASQGTDKNEALSNLTEALSLHFEEPRATVRPQLEDEQ